LILATGGCSYPFTGSSGEGLEIAKLLNHEIIPTRPGLVPLDVRENVPGLLEGLTLKNVRLKCSAKKGSQSKKRLSEIGELLFTATGISGPLILTLSGMLVDWLREGMTVKVEIDLKPALSEKALEDRLLREFQNSPKKTIKNILSRLLPDAMIPVFLDAVSVSSEKQVSHITQKERDSLIALFKGFPLTVVRDRSMNKAMITQGGIALREINPRTMESRKIKGLYFAGEMIDVAGDTGGFNLQAAFSTGYLAGESAARSLTGNAPS